MKLKNLLTTANAKTSKGESLGFLTGILYLSPSDKSGLINLCKFASKGCKASCLDTAGRGQFASVQTARHNKTALFVSDKAFFLESLVWSIHAVIRKATREGLKPCIRLNGTSDIVWEDIIVKDNKNIFELFPIIQFYDYTTDPTRDNAFLGKWSNYHLTFSRKESKSNNRDAEKLLSKGVNVSAVYLDADKAMQATIKAVNGDLHDLRFLDPKGGNIVVLKAKGKARKDMTNFVIRNA